jgi:hypothetical protein
MTLILTAATRNKVVQASDRRVTYRDGSYRDTQNKAVSVTCLNAVFSIGFTGAAEIRGKSTDQWLTDNLTSLKAATVDLGSIHNAIVDMAEGSYQDFSIPELSFVLSGFVGRSSFTSLISNYEKWNPNQFIPATKKFHIQGTLVKEGIRRRKALSFAISGAEKAIKEDIDSLLKQLRRRQFFEKNDANSIAVKLVEIVRRASLDKDYGKYIGRDCMTVAMTLGKGVDSDFLYHPENSTTVRYAPHIIHPKGTIKDIKIDGPPSLGVQFFPDS